MAPCMRVSVIIITYNRIETLPSALDALRSQTYPEFEVIVVNGPSDDGTTAYLELQGGQIKSATCVERNIGRSRNIGVELAAGEIVAFIDDDAVPSEHWIEKLVAAYGNPLTAGAGGPVFDLRYDRIVWRICACSRFGDFVTDAAPPISTYLGKNADPFLYLAGCNMSFRRSVLAGAGGFNEHLTYGYDDVDICRHLVDAGHDIAFVDDALVYHRPMANAVRDSEGVIRDIHSFIRARAIFALQYESVKTATEIIANLNACAADWRATADHNFGQKIFSVKERDDFVHGVDQGLVDGIAVGRAKRHVRVFVPASTNSFRPFREGLGV